VAGLSGLAWEGRGSVILAGASGITGFASSGTVTLYVTSNTSTIGGISTIVDSSGAGGALSGTAANINAATPIEAGANYAFRGLAFVPRAGIDTTAMITAITSAPTAEFLQEVTFSAEVVAASGGDAPTGVVQFRSGNVLLATATLTGSSTTASATVATTAIPFGTYSGITARFIPDGNASANLFNPSVSAAFGEDLVVEPQGAVTTTVLAEISTLAASYGDLITFSGTVTGDGAGTPTGTIQIRAGGPTGPLLAAGDVVAGAFSVSTDTLVGGSYAGIVAVFSGVAGFQNSVSASFEGTLEVAFTQLGLGDIAFMGYQPAAPDAISFVLLRDVIAGTTLTITDKPWSGTALGSGEGTSTITFTQAFSAGTVFEYLEYDIVSGDIDGERWAEVIPGDFSTDGLFDVTSSSFGMSTAGDNLFAYQGAAPTSGTASNWIAGFSTLLFLTEGDTTTQTSYLPEALAAGNAAFSLGLAANDPQGRRLADLGTVTGTPAQIRAVLANPTNWVTTSSFTDFRSGTVFVVDQTASPFIGTTGSLSAVTTTYGTASGTTTITVTGSGLSGDITATAPTGFEVSSDGTLFGPTATFTPASGTVNGTLSVRLAATTDAGTYAGDVSFTSTGASTVTAAMPSSTVGQKGLTITGLTAASRVYDGTTAATLSGTAALFGLIGGDDVSLTGTGSGAFNSKDVNTANAVSVTGFSLLGAKALNYSLTQPTLSASIQAKALTVRADNQTRVVNTANPTLTATIMGFVNGETAATAVTGSAALATTAVLGSAAGSYPITVGVGTLAATNGNYTFSTLVNGTLSVTNAPVKVTGLFVKGTTSGLVTGWAANYLSLSPFTSAGGSQLGWQLPDGSAQLAAASRISWNNVNTISVRFDQPISQPAVSAVLIVGKVLTGYSGSTPIQSDVTITPASVTLLDSGRVAEFVLPQALATGRYVLSIASTGITDSAGTTFLDGNWTTGTSTFAQGSGDGTAGGIFNFSFNVLVGDLDGNGAATVGDQTALRNAIRSAVGTVPTADTFRLDINGSHRLNLTDVTQWGLGLLRSLGTTLTSLSATPTAPTASLPTIGSPTFTSVTATGARLGATITSTGGEPVLERGVVVLAGETGTPNVDDPAAVTLLSAGGAGTFTVDVTGLTPSTVYRFRAFMRTSLGIVYSEVASFTTLAGS
jgi:hypothetical protein